MKKLFLTFAVASVCLSAHADVINCYTDNFNVDGTAWNISLRVSQEIVDVHFSAASPGGILSASFVGSQSIGDTLEDTIVALNVPYIYTHPSVRNEPGEQTRGNEDYELTLNYLNGKDGKSIVSALLKRGKSEKSGKSELLLPCQPIPGASF